MNKVWQANVFTIFPEAFPGNLGVSLIGKALKQSLWQLKIVDLKLFPVKSDRIDSIPYGGGDGMVLSPITFEKAFNTLTEREQKMRKIYFSPRGRQFTQKDFADISSTDGITMLCGRYEGVDQRILDFYEFEEISIGDFVLMGGEAAAMVAIEGCVRLLPEVVGNEHSIKDDSFQQQLLEHNQYTRPQIFHELEVPKVLSSGNHAAISEFRTAQSKQITMNRRPDVWSKYIAESLGNYLPQKNT